MPSTTTSTQRSAAARHDETRPATEGEPPPATGPGRSTRERHTALHAPAALPLVALTAAGLLAGSGASQLGVTFGLLLGILGATFLAGLCSTLSASLLRTLPTTLGAEAATRDASAEIERHLGAGYVGTERLAASASVAAFVLRAAVAAFVHALVGRTLTLELPAHFALTALLSGPFLHVTTQSLPLAIAQAHGERLLVQALPAVAPALRPFSWIASFLTSMRRPVLRLLGTPDASHNTRRLVEGFRAIVEEAELQGELGAATQELIANVIEFSHADAAEVMTPRTEIRAIAMDEPLEAAVAVFAESGYSRIPVYRESIDTIVGTLTALEAAKAVAEKRLETTRIVNVMRPPLLVPETKLVPELLADFRNQRQKMAIVVDEYGGTAGLVTLADVMAEILGVVQDEYTSDDERFVPLEDGAVNADASLHVSEVNEELDLEIPEESDFETLAGFVLSEFGRFPAVGESFRQDGVLYRVLEATDRRVLRVAILPPNPTRPETLRPAFDAAARPQKAGPKPADPARERANRAG